MIARRPHQEEDSLIRLAELAQELADRERRTYLVIDQPDRRMEYTSPTPYAVCEAHASMHDRLYYRLRVEPRI